MEPEGYERAKNYWQQAFEAQAAQAAKEDNKSWQGEPRENYQYKPDEKKTVTFYILQGGPHSGEKHLVDSKCKTLLVFDKSQTAHVYALDRKVKFVHSLLPGEIKMKDTLTSWGKKDEYEPLVVDWKDLNLE